ncbi:hypothetical protein [Rubritalea sp.]|uniref:hypothetical protein n=1 Tax=Rubritalea sp. TaxID=2109375 RepID=UPI003EF2E930
MSDKLEVGSVESRVDGTIKGSLEEFSYSGEGLFLFACLSIDLSAWVKDRSDGALAELGRYIQGHAADHNKGVAGLVHECAVVELGLRALEEGAAVSDDEALERAEGFDSAFAESGKCGVRSEECLHDETTEKEAGE